MEPTTAPTSPRQSFNWEALVPLLVHPVKVEIIEAMRWVEVPLSATDLDRVFHGKVGVSLLSYHLRKLTELGALRRYSQEQVRGAVQTFYALASEGPSAIRATDPAASSRPAPAVQPSRREGPVSPPRSG